jgi:hypothetical protein
MTKLISKVLDVIIIALIAVVLLSSCSKDTYMMDSQKYNQKIQKEMEFKNFKVHKSQRGKKK